MSGDGPYVIGIDGGTESLRAGVFDLAGRPLAFAATAYRTDFPQPGWAEQNPKDWWTALGASVRQAVQEAGIAPEAVAALALDTTCCSVVALDDQGEALRPALIWMDVRSAEETERVVASGDAALKINGGGAGPVSAEWMIPKALWLQRHEPEVFDRAATICEYQDYLNYHLTGRRVASINNAAIRWHYLAADGGFQPGLLAKLGIDALMDKWPSEVLPLGAVIGGLTARAAEHLGLPKDLLVAQGGADAFIGMIGLGVVRPGSLAFLTGSSHLHLGLSETAFHGAGIWGTYADAVIPGLHVVEGGQTSTGSVVKWFRELLGGGVSYDDLNAEARDLPPGSEGLIVQDHFQGNRTPHTDPLSRGAFAGLTLKHAPRAHVPRHHRRHRLRQRTHSGDHARPRFPATRDRYRRRRHALRPLAADPCGRVQRALESDPGARRAQPGLRHSGCRCGWAVPGHRHGGRCHGCCGAGGRAGPAAA